jgi:hypothetical protein
VRFTDDHYLGHYCVACYEFHRNVPRKIHDRTVRKFKAIPFDSMFRLRRVNCTALPERVEAPD